MKLFVTYKFNSCVFEAWSLVCLPAWLLNKSDAVFFVCEIALQLSFGKFPCCFVLVEVGPWCWFLLPLWPMTNIISDGSSFCRKEFCSLGDWLLGPVEFGLVFGWSWHETLLNLSFFSEHASLRFLLFMIFNWEKVFDWGFWIIFLETERWYSQYVFNYVTDCKALIVLGITSGVGPWVVLVFLAELLKVLLEAS